jgi:hypothetical protein
MRRTFVALGAFFILLGLAATASAQDGLLNSIQDYLDRTSNYLNDHRIGGKVKFSPYVAQRVIYDDNIWLNDKDEAGTRGRVWDVISDSTVQLALVLPVNREFSKMYEEIFGRSEVTLLSYRARFLEYARRGVTDSINQDIHTDLFGFLEDLLSLGLEGRRMTFDVGAKYSDVSDPIDILVRDLNLPGFPTRFLVNRIRRRAIDAHATLGYRGNQFDAKVGYEFHWLDFNNDFFQQANLDSHTGWLEAGISPPFLGEKRAYARFTYKDLRFRKHLLNDARVMSLVLGVEGPLLSKKLRFVAEGGGLYWDSRNTGLLADDNDFRGAVGLVRVVYRPFSERNLRVQLEGRRWVDWSAISNYRVDNTATLTVFNEFSKKLDADVTFSISHHSPSEGPIRTLYEAGAGVTYHLFKQVDVSARYLFRLQSSRREEVLSSVDGLGNVTTIRTDGDFYQSVFSLGVEIQF